MEATNTIIKTYLVNCYIAVSQLVVNLSTQSISGFEYYCRGSHLYDCLLFTTGIKIVLDCLIGPF